MPNVTTYVTGKYLKAADVEGFDKDQVFKIIDVVEEELTDRQGRSEKKIVIHFDEAKPLACNTTTGLSRMLFVAKPPNTGILDQL